jgi:hypothetical protein
MTDTQRPLPPRTEPALGDDDVSIQEVVDYVKQYALQETVGPIKNAGRWLGFGVAGAFALGIGFSLVLLGVLRLIQTEWDRVARGSLSWIPYLITLVVAGLIIWITVSRINKSSLEREPTA